MVSKGVLLVVLVTVMFPLLATGCDSSPFGILFGESSENSFECRMVDPSEPGNSYNIDDRLASISRSVDGGFGGHYYDPENDALVIYMLEPENREAAEEIRSRLTSLYGRAEEWENTALEVKQGHYTVDQLLKWKDLSTNILSLQGVHMQDLDEGSNRLTFGVSTEANDPPAIEDCVLKNADNLGIPRKAINIEMTPPTRPLVGE